MNEDWKDRTRIILGEEKLETLVQKHVLVIGVGGVGAYVVEMLVRTGIGNITIIDGDHVAVSNLNRQLPALTSTIGTSKVEVMRERMLAINPKIKIKAIHQFIEPHEVKTIITQKKFDYIVDAIDSIDSKIALLETAVILNLPIISSMGAGGKVDPSKIELSSLAKTHQCALAKKIRKKLRDEYIKKQITVVFSSECIEKKAIQSRIENNKKTTIIGTVPYIPAIFGCYIASYVIKKLTSND